MKTGMSLKKACKEAAADLVALKGSWLGGVTISAIDKTGDHYVLAVGESGGTTYYVQSADMNRCEKREGDVFPLK